MIKNPADNNRSGGMANAPIRVTKYRALKDKYVGAPGTAEREQFEFELSLELMPLKNPKFPSSKPMRSM